MPSLIFTEQRRYNRTLKEVDVRQQYKRFRRYGVVCEQRAQGVALVCAC